MSDDKKKKDGGEVEQMPNAENLRLRQEVSELKNAVEILEGERGQIQQSFSMQIKGFAVREEAHLSALKAFGSHSALGDLNKTRYEAIGKDMENFLKAIKAINARLEKIEQRLPSESETEY